MNILHKFRLEKAAQLLIGTNRQIYEIAADVGYDCGIHFTRKFREAFGETPSAFRKRKKCFLFRVSEKVQHIVHEIRRC